jgi:hypothetical protein
MAEPWKFEPWSLALIVIGKYHARPHDMRFAINLLNGEKLLSPNNPSHSSISFHIADGPVRRLKKQ